MSQKIIVSTTVNQPIKKVWEYWTSPEHIVHWNFASDDWECPRAINDLTEGGRFDYTMAAKDGSVDFEFEGTYTYIEQYNKISYSMDDGRNVDILFEQVEGGVKLTEIFDSEEENSPEMQQAGWQAILDTFVKYTNNAL